VKSSDGPNVGIDRSVSDWVKSPFSVFTGSPADACPADAPGSARLPCPPAVVPAGTSPPAEGASAWVAEDTGAPSSRYGCPFVPSEAVKFAVASEPAS
jgi:hypothetical protein